MVSTQAHGYPPVDEVRVRVYHRERAGDPCIYISIRGHTMQQPTHAVEDGLSCEDFRAALQKCHKDGGFSGKFSNACSGLKDLLDDCLTTQYYTRYAENKDKAQSRMERYEANKAYTERLRKE